MVRKRLRVIGPVLLVFVVVGLGLVLLGGQVEQRLGGPDWSDVLVSPVTP